MADKARFGTRLRLKPIAALIAVALLAACGGSKPDVDEAPFLADLGFDKPIEASIILGLQVDDNDNIRPNDDRINAVALAMAAGYVRVIPDAEGRPWWRFSVTDGTLSNRTLTFLVAKRIVTGHSDERRWTEDGRDCFAETVSYRLELDPRLKSLLQASVEERVYSFRLVVFDDPVAGKWRLADVGNTFNRRDEEDVLAAIHGAGAARVDTVYKATDEAKAAGDLIVAANLMRQFGFDKSADGQIIYRRQFGRAYLRKAFTLAPGTTYVAARSLCENVHKDGLTWHWTLPVELTSLLIQKPNEWVMDTPRYALWGPDLGPGAVVVADSWRGYAGSTRSGGYRYLSYSLQKGGVAMPSAGWSDDYSKTLDAVEMHAGNKVLCVAAISR